MNLEEPKNSWGWTILICLLALSWQLGVRGLNEPDEGRYASVATTMLRTGDWIVPHFQGHPHLTKPPLIYWLTALSFYAGGYNEWSARLVPALAALGTLLLTWGLGTRWLGPRHGFYAALILLSSPLFFIVARLCDPNMLLTFWITLGLWAAVRWQDEGQPYQRTLYYLAHGLAFLTKGPVGCIIIGLGQWAFRGYLPIQPSRRLRWWPGIIMASLLGLSWYILMIIQQPDRLDYFVRYELLDRIFTNTHRRGEPVWFFLWVLPLTFLPWLPLLVRAGARGWPALRASFPEGPLIRFTLFILVFFSISRSKLPTYILPALPALALLAAAQLDWDEVRSRSFRWPKRVAALLAVLFPVVMILISEAKTQTSHWLHGSTLLALTLIIGLLLSMKRAPAYRWLVPAAAVILTSYAALLDVVRRHERAMLGESTSQLVLEWRRVLDEPPREIYFTHAPAGLEFYLNQGPTPKFLSLAKSGTHMTVEEFSTQMTDYLRALSGRQASVVVSTHHMQKLTSTGLTLPAHVVVQDRKYTVLQAP
jgi:4-amino-4-deoxy-L-arabinose transferase-like glycosyltransferase